MNPSTGHIKPKLDMACSREIGLELAAKLATTLLETAASQEETTVLALVRRNSAGMRHLRPRQMSHLRAVNSALDQLLSQNPPPHARQDLERAEEALRQVELDIDKRAQKLADLARYTLPKSDDHCRWLTVQAALAKFAQWAQGQGLGLPRTPDCEEDCLNPPVLVAPCQVDKRRAVHVVRDDVLLGGTKQRALGRMLARSSALEFVYAGPVFGLAQVALAHCARIFGKRATLVLEDRFHPLTERARTQGAVVRAVPRPCQLRDVQNEAARYVEAKVPGSVVCLPFGLHSYEYISDLKAALEAALPADLQPQRLWLVAGSATLLAVLSLIWPDCHFLVVQVGKKIWDDQLYGIRATLYVAPESFEVAARIQPPYPTVATYDAKLWQFVLQHGRDGDVVWNVGSD